MQAKDVSDRAVLEFLRDLRRDEPANPPWGTWFSGFDNSVDQAMPAGTPSKVCLAKMRGLIRRGHVSGCGCGCRGDFELTDKGRAYLETLS